MNASDAGKAIHIPVIPNAFESAKANKIIATIPLETDIIEDSNALSVAL